MRGDAWPAVRVDQSCAVCVTQSQQVERGKWPEFALSIPGLGGPPAWQPVGPAGPAVPAGLEDKVAGRALGIVIGFHSKFIAIKNRCSIDKDT